MTYFLSDLHFGHDKKFIYEARGYNSIQEHDERLIDKINSIVKNSDDFWILGDCFLNDSKTGIANLKRLNGRKHLIIGNHDSDTKIKMFKKENIFEDIRYGYRLKVTKNKIFILSHYPTFCGNHTNDYVWNISGHTHNTSFFEFGDKKIFNVSVDALDGFPIEKSEILTMIERSKYE
jgi:calcineurin-like phosphoesterase family protein